MQNRPILIMAGGTGGHIYPALAVAECLQKRNIPVLWLGTKNGLESTIIPQHNYQLLTINISGLRGKGIQSWITAPFFIVSAICKMIIILFRYKPIVVLGMGGYTSGPGGIATWLMRIPLCVHEQNTVAGLTNRFLARLANTMMVAHDGTFATSTNVHVTGNPVRQDIINITAPEQRFKQHAKQCFHLLIIGGSLGASTLNRVVPEALAMLLGDVNFKVRHQTGANHLAQTKEFYQSLDITAELHAYTDNIAVAYEWADVIVCRAGAITIAEITAAGLASILIPYPSAVDDHQTSNARYLSDKGAAILLHERELNAHALANVLRKLALNQKIVLKMATMCLALNQYNATERIADLCMEAAYV